jgi:hypothetical protein
MMANVRVNDHRVVEKSARRRKRRAKLAVNGKLAILAGEPAGRVTKSVEDSYRLTCWTLPTQNRSYRKERLEAGHPPIEKSNRELNRRSVKSR